MKKTLIHTISLTLCASAQAAVIASDNFDDNSINSALWSAQVVQKDEPSTQDLSYQESSQRLNLRTDSPADVPLQSTLRQSLLTNVGASFSWSATVNISNTVDVNMSPSVRLGLVVTDSTLSNTAGIYLKADDGGRRIQDAGFFDVSPTPASISTTGTISLDYDHTTRMLAVGYANGIGNSVINFQNIDTSTWDNTAANGFRFHLQGTVTATDITTGSAFFDDFSVQSVPEPSSTLLLGIASLILIRRNRT